MGALEDERRQNDEIAILAGIFESHPLFLKTIIILFDHMIPMPINGHAVATLLFSVHATCPLVSQNQTFRFL